MDIIKVDKLRKVYKIGKEKVVALDNINIEIKKGEICCILGTSGSGKSTLLNMLAGLEKPTRGDIIINKSAVNKLSEKKLALFRQKYIGFVFQSYNLIPTLTAEENVALPLVFRRMGKRKRTQSSLKMLKLVGLGDRTKHKPTQMSGGQQQRVGIARAFVAKPAVVFADEPTGNLDSRTTIEVMTLMVKIARDNNQTLVIVTHDREIAEYADRIIQLKDGGVIADYQTVTPNKDSTEKLGEISK
ncbi:MAG: ABC transporter ATP-binding protein [Oscillospiraceae bacterium]|nr:ABC transporter ATP-binding protein [Oscillospiraceae bacterium]